MLISAGQSHGFVYGPHISTCEFVKSPQKEARHISTPFQPESPNFAGRAALVGTFGWHADNACRRWVVGIRSIRKKNSTDPSIRPRPPRHHLVAALEVAPDQAATAELLDQYDQFASGRQQAGPLPSLH
ncbi:hypothetical protein ACFVXH_14365 [Kitasatospora sp. NPDC058184]|uniref:hypothetical protein n=1 Tax=Kitasatospora sp. NPDC058184 TaxID=3346370 RepID=UPI0036D88E2C